MTKHEIITIGDKDTNQVFGLFILQDGSEWQQPNIISKIFESLQLARSQSAGSPATELRYHGLQELDRDVSQLQDYYFKTSSDLAPPS